MTKVTLFGNQQIAIDILRYLKRQKKVHIVGVVGCETESDLAFGYPSLKKYCEEENIPYVDADTYFHNFDSMYRRYKADIFLSIYFRKIFSKKHLQKLGEIINIHPSLLPKYRGPSPTLWALLNNEKYTGVTIHIIDQLIDNGDILIQKKVKIPKNITGYELNTLTMKIGVQLFKNIFPIIRSGELKRFPQKKTGMSYYGKYHAGVRKIDWFQSSEYIRNKIRALTHPYSGAVTFFKGEPVVFWSAEIVFPLSHQVMGPGKIVKVSKKSLIVTTTDALLKISSYSYEGKGDMPILKKGDMLDIAI